ncbi:MAG: hypothetical protein AABX89_00025 [Candidatus Thermoplasmatota archaeon]
MVSAQLVASILTLLPAMAILFWILNRYEGYFEQNRLFFALILGIFSGLLLRFLELFLFQFETAATVMLQGLWLSLLYTAIGYSVLEALANQAVLGFKKFRSRKDTPYYGASLGVGFGAMWSLQVATILVQPVVSPALVLHPATAAKLLEATLMSAGLVMVHAGAAIWVGKGSSDGKLWRGAMIGAFWLMPALAIYWFIVAASPGLLPAAAMAGYGLFVLLQAQTRILETIVPIEVREMVRRERRRNLRKGT